MLMWFCVFIVEEIDCKNYSNIYGWIYKILIWKFVGFCSESLGLEELLFI